MHLLLNFLINSSKSLSQKLKLVLWLLVQILQLADQVEIQPGEVRSLSNFNVFNVYLILFIQIIIPDRNQNR